MTSATAARWINIFPGGHESARRRVGRISDAQAATSRIAVAIALARIAAPHKCGLFGVLIIRGRETGST
jgi:hypothetical protein